MKNAVNLAWEKRTLSVRAYRCLRVLNDLWVLFFFCVPADDICNSKWIRVELLQSDILTDIIHYESTKFHPEFMAMPCSTLLHYAGHIKSQINKKRKKKKYRCSFGHICSCHSHSCSKGDFFFIFIRVVADLLFPFCLDPSLVYFHGLPQDYLGSIGHELTNWCEWVFAVCFTCARAF